MGDHTRPAERLDGSVGGLVARTEPKVAAASVAATVTPLLLWVLHTYVPGAASLPDELGVPLGVAVTGAVTWLAGFATRTVHRVDVPGGGPPPGGGVAGLDVGELVDAVAELVFDRLVAAGALPGDPPEPEPVPVRGPIPVPPVPVAVGTGTEVLRLVPRPPAA